MAKKKHKSQNQPQPTKPRKGGINSLVFIKEALTLIGGLAGSILAVYGLVKTFKDDTEGFSWLILVGIVIWLLILWQLFQIRKTTAYSLLIISILVGVVGWIGWQSQVKATDKKVVVLVAKFDGPEETYGLRGQILEQLRVATSGYTDTEIIASDTLVTVEQGSEYARKLGEEKNADLVIWAWYKPIDNPNITIHIENLSTAQIEILQESEVYKPEAKLADLKSFAVQKKLGSETSTLISFLSGLVRFKSGDYQTAIERFEQVLVEKDVSIYINQADLHFFLGYSYYELGDYEQAIQVYDIAIRLDSTRSEIFGNRGNAFFGLGQFDKAIEDYNNVIKLNPNDYLAYFNRGLVYKNLKQYNAALNDYNTVIELNPNYAWVYNDRGDIYNTLMKYEYAIQDFNKALEIDSNFTPAIYNRGLAYYFLKQYDQALDDCNKAIALDPLHADSFTARGLVYVSQGQHQRAIQDFDKAIDLNPENALAYYNRGRAYFFMEQYERAIEDYGKSISLDKNYAMAYNNRGAAYSLLRQYELAIQDFDKAIELDPTNPGFYQNRGFAYQFIDKATEAEADFKKYEELTGQELP